VRRRTEQARKLLADAGVNLQNLENEIVVRVG